MDRLEKALAGTAERNETALVAYLTCGYPSVTESMDLVRAVSDAGADVIELGVPFSDPLGDGTLIQRTTHHALDQGVTPAAVLEAVAELRDSGVETPIMLMGYCNPFLRYGLSALYADAVRVGVDGFIVPDLPAHEAEEWLAEADANSLAQVFFTAPGSSRDRLRATTASSRGFVYALAANGVTGVREELAPDIEDYLGRVRDAAGALPICVGFGISRPEHITALRDCADGVIVGSALLQAISDADGPAQRTEAAARLISELKAACR